MLGNNQINAQQDRMTYSFIVQPTDVSFNYQYAAVLNDPGHVPANQPFFDFVILDQLGDTVPCSYQHYIAAANLPGWQTSNQTNPSCNPNAAGTFVYYKPWTIVGVNLSGYVGQPVTVVCTVSDCSQCGHFGIVYLDFACTALNTGQFCMGDTSTMLVAPYDPAFTYNWSTGATTDTIYVNPNNFLPPNDTVTVHVSQASSICPFDFAFVLAPTQITPGIWDSIHCNTAYFADTSVISAGTISNWNWTFTGGTPSTFSGQSPPPITYSPGTYSVSLVLTSMAGCKDSITQTITINPPPVITTNNVAVCQNQTDTICASGGVSYSWNPTGQTTSCIIVGTAFSSYTVTGTDANGCTATAIANVNTNAAPVIIATGDQVCAGSLANLSASGGVSYVWTPASGLSCVNCPNPIAGPIAGPTTYSVVGTDANGCTNSDTALITITPSPTIIAGPNATICIGRDSAQITAGGAGIGGTYIWTPSIGLSCTTCQSTWAFPNFSNTYTVTGTNTDGCSNTATVSITVGAIPFVSAIAPTTICNGDSATLNANTSNGTPPYSYYWSPPNDLNNPTLQNPTSGAANSTPYTVTVTDANGCTDDTSTFLNVETVPSITWASWTPELTCDGYVIPLKANVSSNGNSVIWNFGDGSSPLVTYAPNTDAGPHSYPFNGTYTLSVVVFNVMCTDTVDTVLVVSDMSGFLNVLPANVFTPNNDGLNDFFHPAFVPAPNSNLSPDTLESLQECLEMEVWDRWGIKMFESTPAQKYWDGKTMGGKDAKEGTYYYIATFGEVKLPGYVTLLRAK
jgi:gliding motility-associated-like protein